MEKKDINTIINNIAFSYDMDYETAKNYYDWYGDDAVFLYVKLEEFILERSKL